MNTPLSDHDWAARKLRWLMDSAIAAARDEYLRRANALLPWKH